MLHQAAPVSDVQVVVDVRDASLPRVFDMEGKPEMSASLLAQKRQQLAHQVHEEMLAVLGQAGVSMQPVFSRSVHVQVKLTDDGETPVSWRNAYIGFEVVTTLAIAAAFFEYKVTRSWAGIYLLEESAEEISEGYAGCDVTRYRWCRGMAGS